MSLMVTHCTRSSPISHPVMSSKNNVGMKNTRYGNHKNDKGGGIANEKYEKMNLKIPKKTWRNREVENKNTATVRMTEHRG